MCVWQVCENSLEEERYLPHCRGPAGRQESWWQERLVRKVTHLVVMREQKEEVGKGQGKKRTCSRGLKFLEPPKVMSPVVDHSFTTRVCREHFTFKLTAFHK